MNKDQIEDMLNRVDVPTTTNVPHREEFKIPLLGYRPSSKVGLWLLVLPFIVALTYVVKYDLALTVGVVTWFRSIFSAVEEMPVLNILIPIILVGLPVAAMVMNMLAIAHVAVVRERREVIITVKYRIFNILVVLASFAILVFFLLPDRASF